MQMQGHCIMLIITHHRIGNTLNETPTVGSFNSDGSSLGNKSFWRFITDKLHLVLD